MLPQCFPLVVYGEQVISESRRKLFSIIVIFINNQPQVFCSNSKVSRYETTSVCCNFNNCLRSFEVIRYFHLTGELVPTVAIPDRL